MFTNACVETPFGLDAKRDSNVSEYWLPSGCELSLRIGPHCLTV